MSISKDIIVDALRLRYDAYSAETIFELACNRAELQGKTTLEGRELAAFRAALEKVGDRVGSVLARLDELSGNPPPKSEKSESKAVPAETKDEKSDSKPVPTETKSEKSDAKPVQAETKDEKSDSKPVPSEAKAEAKSDSKPNKKDSKSNEP
jgi:hypothetical protein